MRATALTAGVLAALVAGCAAGPAAPQAAPSAAASGPCQEPEFPELQGDQHLTDEDAEPPVPYSSTPGTSGWHWSGPDFQGVVDEPLRETRIVTTLELGNVVAAYDAEALSSEDVARLAELAQGPYAPNLTVTPFEKDMGAPLVYNAWGVRQACTSLDEDALEAFVRTFTGRGPGIDR